MTDKMTLEQFFEDSDWNYAFNETRGKAGNPTTREVMTFKMSDVSEIIAIVKGEGEGPDWAGLFRTNDGVYLYVEGNCCYTGWNCGGRASAEWHTDLEQAKAMISEHNRIRLFPEAP